MIHMRRLTISIAMALAAAACGGGTTSETFGSLDATSSETLGTTTTTTLPIHNSSPDTTIAPQPAEPTELPESDYPDVVVADLAGGEMNLRELAFENEPVLLWFWAPH